jgi:BirA family biotin operon repressor/biotin-[acetyl-CoA-carboxylase] ligase
LVEVSEIYSRIRTRFLEPKLYYYDKVDSTNKIAKTLLLDGAGEGTIIIADRQNAGKGRLDRAWWSPNGGVYVSLIVEPKAAITEFHLLSLLAGCAAVEAIESLSKLKVRLKWPNDIMLNEKKLGGILCELVSRKTREYSVIVGIGINQNIAKEDIPLELRDCATSIKVESGKSGSREKLIALLINCIDSWLYHADTKSSLSFITSEWINFSSTIGRDVEVTTQTGKTRGKAIGISEVGSLLLSTSKGIIEFSAGDVFHIGSNNRK